MASARLARYSVRGYERGAVRPFTTFNNVEKQQDPQLGPILKASGPLELPWDRNLVEDEVSIRVLMIEDPAQAATQVNAAMERLVRAGAQQYLWGYARYKQPREEAVA